MIKDEKYDKNTSPIILQDTSQISDFSIPYKMVPNCLTIDGNTIYLGTRNSRVFIYRFENHELLDEVKVVANYKVVSSITVGDLYFILTPESTEKQDQKMSFSIWDKKQKQFQVALNHHKSQISKVLFLYKEGFIATASWDTTIKIWQIDDKFQQDQPIKSYQNQSPILAMQTFQRDMLAFGDDDCFLTLWNWETEEKIQRILGHGGSVTFICPFQSLILTGGGDNNFKVIGSPSLMQKQLSQSFHEQSMSLEMTKGKLIQNEMKNEMESSRNLLRESELIVNRNLSTLNSFQRFYHSELYSCQIDKGKNLLIDSQGKMFIFDKNCQNPKENMKQVGNCFPYNENVKGIVKHKNYLIIPTTKCVIKVFEYSLKQS